MTHDNASGAAGVTKRVQALSIVGGAALMLICTGPAPAAITPSDVNPWQHIIDCAKALFSNPAEHAQFCAPGRAEPLTFRSSFTWQDPTAPVPSSSSSSSSSLPPG